MKNQVSRYQVYIKPVLKNKSIKTYSPFVFSLLTTLFFVFFTIRPTVATIISLQESIKEQTQIKEQLTTKAEALGQGKRNYEALGTNVQNKLINLLPETSSLPDLLDDLYALALAHEASVSGIQLEPSQLEQRTSELSKDAVVSELSFTINTQGSYTDLLNLLNAINKSSRLISIETINLSKRDTGGSKSVIVMSLNAKAFYLKSSGSTAPASSQINNQTAPLNSGGGI